MKQKLWPTAHLGILALVFAIAPVRTQRARAVDCNNNAIDDAEDITARTSADCNGNNVPDECEADSNANGVPDDCDVAFMRPFAEGEPFLVRGRRPYRLATGDLDRDGDIDIAVMTEDTVTLMLNDGDGTFSRAGRIVVGGQSLAVAVGDFDGDGANDPAVVSQTMPSIFVYANDGSAGFVLAQTLVFTGTPVSVHTLDVDQDGRVDLVAGTSGELRILRNVGDGQLGLIQTIRLRGVILSVASGDLDGDGDPDLAVTNTNAEGVSVLLNEGDGTFVAQPRMRFDANPHSVAMADFVSDLRGPAVYRVERATQRLSNSTGCSGGGSIGPRRPLWRCTGNRRYKCRGRPPFPRSLYCSSGG